MADGPLPDHYKALGVDKNVDSATIKSTYRKLVLKCHPDKVADPTLKEEATAKFHSIQQAYETLIDDEKRADYEAHLTLEKLRKEKAARASAPRGERTARFEQPTSGGASFTATGAPRYTYATEERRPSRTYDDDRYYEDRKRDKYDTYDAYPKASTSSRSRNDKESSSRSAKPAATDRTRDPREKARAKDLRSDRKFAHPESESSSDEKARYEADYKRRSQEDEARKQAEASRRKAEDRRSYEERDPRDARHTIKPEMSEKEKEAIRYQHKSRVQVESEMSRPSPVRTSSRDYYGSEHRSHRTSQRETRPEAVRRSSARPKDRPASTSRRDSDRGIPETVDWPDESSRRPPPFKHSASSPANIEIPRGAPVRAYTDAPSSRDQRRPERSPPPAFHRSSTMPTGGIAHASSSRKKDTTVHRPSTLRETVTPEHGIPEGETYPSVPSAQPASASKTTYYRYDTPGGGVSVRPEDLAGSATKPRTVLREPGRHHHQRSPSPLSRPPIGPNRPSEASTYTTKTAAPRPPMGRTDSSRNYSPPREDRGRSGRPKLYGEIGQENHGRGRQASYSPADVQYAPKYGPEDVRWAPRSRENDREYASKPSLGRTATYVY
jgi:curved DNA-binding protein CbpA